MRDAVIEIVLIHVRIHPDALARKDLVILGPRQRCQEKELQNINWQFSLYDFNITGNRFLAVGRKTEDVTRIGDGAVIAPHLQHFPIFGDLVLPLLGGDEIVRIDVLQPNKDPPHAGPGGFLDELRNLMAKGVDLDGESDIHPLALPQLDHAVEQRLPITIAREIIVRDEEPLDTLRIIITYDLFQIVGRADAALAALHIDDGAKRALVGTAAAEIDARQRAGGPPHMLTRQEWGRFARECR